MIKSDDIENRAARGVADSEAAIRRMRAPTVRISGDARPEPEPEQPSAAEQELAALKARIAEARKLPPPHHSIVDGRSWAMGRDAALAALDGP